MRDLETVSLALTAAETGHLVFGTLHTSGAPNTINRIIDVFPPEQQAQIRAQISTSLKMVVTQRLLKTKDGQGRVGAFEVMKCNAPIQNLIREAKIHQIPSIMQTAVKDGMITMTKSLERAVRSDVDKIAALIKNTYTQTERGALAYVQIYFNQTDDGLFVEGRGLTMSTLATKINNGDDDWNDTDKIGERCDPGASGNSNFRKCKLGYP